MFCFRFVLDLRSIFIFIITIIRPFIRNFNTHTHNTQNIFIEHVQRRHIIRPCGLLKFYEANKNPRRKNADGAPVVKRSEYVNIM